MSRAAARRDAGFVPAKRGTREGAQGSRQTYAPQNPGSTRRTALLKVFDRQPPEQRQALLAHLDSLGRTQPKARKLAAELRERWRMT